MWMTKEKKWMTFTSFFEFPAVANCAVLLEHGMTFHNFSECSMKSGRQKQTLFGHKLTESCQSITELFLSDPFPPRDILAVYTNSNLTSTVLLYLFLIESLISNVQKQRRSS